MNTDNQWNGYENGDFCSSQLTSIAPCYTSTRYKKSVDRGKTDAYCRGNGNGIGNKKMTLTPDHTGR